VNFRFLRTIDWVLAIVPILLALIGLATIYSLSFANPQTKYFFYNQLIYFAMGIGVAISLSIFDYQSVKTFAPYIFLISLLLLIWVNVFGKTTLGATRWINLGFFQLQPSEIFKYVLIISLAKAFSDPPAHFDSAKQTISAIWQRSKRIIFVSIQLVFRLFWFYFNLILARQWY